MGNNICNFNVCMIVITLAVALASQVEKNVFTSNATHVFQEISAMSYKLVPLVNTCVLEM